MTQYEVMHMENRMLVDSEWRRAEEDDYREPCEWDLWDDEDMVDEY